MKLSFAFLLLLSIYPIWAQEAPAPVLVDEHGQLPCDDSLGRMDVWYADIAKNPGSVGLAVISNSPDLKHLSVFRQRLMEVNARFRGASDSLELKYVRANSAGPLNVQLWRIPKGAENPSIEELDNTFQLPSDIKPFLLSKEFPEPPGWIDFICPGERSDQSIFAEFLKGNPNSRGNIVVRDRTLERARRKAAGIRRDFRKKYQILPTRLRFFLRKASAPTNKFEPTVEFWYLP